MNSSKQTQVQIPAGTTVEILHAGRRVKRTLKADEWTTGNRCRNAGSNGYAVDIYKQGRDWTMYVPYSAVKFYPKF